VFAEQGTALQAVMNDRSAIRHARALTDFAKFLSGTMRQFVASDDPADMLPAQCALGAPCSLACRVSPDLLARRDLMPGWAATQAQAAGRSSLPPPTPPFVPSPSPDPPHGSCPARAQNVQFGVVRVSRPGDQVAEHNGGSARVIWGAGGASEQSRYGLLDSRLRRIFIHRHLWGEYPYLSRTWPSAMGTARDLGRSRVLGRSHREGWRPAMISCLRAGPGTAPGAGG
jgi:hypothetical protein